MERFKLVATEKGLIEVETLPIDVDVIESCTKEQANREWKSYKPTNVTFYVALLIEAIKTLFCQNHSSENITSIVWLLEIAPEDYTTMNFVSSQL